VFCWSKQEEKYKRGAKGKRGLSQREWRGYHRGSGGVITEEMEVLSQREWRCYHRGNGGVITEGVEVLSQREWRELNGRKGGVGAC
jgi:hypothetical protein